MEDPSRAWICFVCVLSGSGFTDRLSVAGREHLWLCEHLFHHLIPFFLLLLLPSGFLTLALWGSGNLFSFLFYFKRDAPFWICSNVLAASRNHQRQCGFQRIWKRNWNCTHFLLTSMSVEALMTISSISHVCSWEDFHSTCLHSAAVVSSKCLEVSPVQFVSKHWS